MDEFYVELKSRDSQLFILLAYLTAGNWDVDEVAGAVEYIKELEIQPEPHLKAVD